MIGPRDLPQQPGSSVSILGWSSGTLGDSSRSTRGSSTRPPFPPRLTRLLGARARWNRFESAARNNDADDGHNWTGDCCECVCVGFLFRFSTLIGLRGVFVLFLSRVDTESRFRLMLDNRPFLVSISLLENSLSSSSFRQFMHAFDSELDSV